MRVLHLTSEENWGGGENQIRLLIENSKSLGVEHFVCSPEGSPLAKRVSETFGHSNSVLSFEEPGFFGSVNPKILEFVRGHEIQILHAQNSKGHDLALSIKKQFPKIRVVVHRRVDFATNKFFSGRKYNSDLVDKYIAISNKIKKNLMETGVPEEKIKLISSAVDLSRFEGLNRADLREKNLKRLGVVGDTVIFGTAARLAPEKGLLDLMGAYEYVIVNRGMRLNGLIAGDGPLRESLKKTISEANIQNYIRLLGHVENVPEFLGGLDYFVLPSHSEGLGSVLIEAMAAGTVCLASNTGGIPDLIEHGKTGFLFPPKDRQGLSDALMSAVINKRPEVAVAAKKQVFEKFGVQKMAEATVQLYREVLA